VLHLAFGQRGCDRVQAEPEGDYLVQDAGTTTVIGDHSLDAARPPFDAAQRLQQLISSLKRALDGFGAGCRSHT
jgi:hypothetical protein